MPTYNTPLQLYIYKKTYIKNKETKTNKERERERVGEQKSSRIYLMLKIMLQYFVFNEEKTFNEQQFLF